MAVSPHAGDPRTPVIASPGWLPRDDARKKKRRPSGGASLDWFGLLSGALQCARQARRLIS
jgi:hypothetical protein